MSDDLIDCVYEIRQEMWRRGYRPVPVLNPDSEFAGAGKRPAGSAPGWGEWEKDARRNPPHAVTTRPLGVAVNTGILADGLQPVDIDVDDADLAEAIDRLAVDMLGNAPLRFREDSSRKLRLYRAADGEPSHAEVQEDAAVAAAGGREKAWGVEILGRGNQFVAAGWHPNGAFLDWKDGRTPASVSRDELPVVTADQCAEFLSIVGDLLGSTRSRQNRQIWQNRSADAQPHVGGNSFVGSGGFVAANGDPVLADVEAAIVVIPGDGGSYKMWTRVAMATHAATLGSPEGLALFDRYSQKSPKYDPNAVTKMWRTLRPRSIGFGSLAYLAREADPTWRAPSWNSGGADPRGAEAAPLKISTNILNRNVASPPVMPLAAFGADWGRWLQEAAVGANAPVDYVGTSLLAVAGSVIGNARWARAWDGWQEPPVLWCALVGEPSASKTPAASAVLKLLRHVEADVGHDFDEIHAIWEETAARAKAERKQWESSLGTGDETQMPRTIVPPEPMRPVAYTSSVTIEKVAAMMQSQPKGFLIANDELAGWLANMERYASGTDRPFWLTAWTGGSYRVDRKTSAAAIIPCLSFGIFGTIQPDRLAGTLTGIDDGLPARFLFSWPDARPFARPRGTVNVSQATDALCRLARLEMQTAEDGSPVPVCLTATDEAAGALETFALDMQAQERQAAGLMVGVLGKARGQALRLALVLECLPWAWSGEHREPMEISANAMRRAIRMMRDYFLPMASRTLGDAAIIQPERDARTLAKWIEAERPEKVNLRELSRGHTGRTPLHGLRDRKRLQAAGEWLQDCGWLQHEALPKTGGRPRSDLLIADGLWAALDDHARLNGQNRLNPVAVDDAVGASVGFDRFVGKDIEAEKAVRTTDDGGWVVDQTGDHRNSISAAATEPDTTASVPRPDFPAGHSVLIRLDEMIAKRRAEERRS